MNKAETLLNEILEADMATYTATPETEPHIVIGNDRSITVPTELQKIAVQFDHNIETVTFDCPRYWDENDMSTMAIYINYRRSDGVLGSYLATNPIVDSNNPDIMHFDWTISQNVTEVKGNISFLVCIRKTDTEGNVSNHWNSELCNELYVSEGLETKDTILAKQPDLVTQLVQLVTKYENVDMSGKLDKNQGADNSGKILRVGTDGNVEPGVPDKTLTKPGEVADAKAVGDQLTSVKDNLGKLDSELIIKANIQFNKYLNKYITTNGEWTTANGFSMCDEIAIPEGATKVRLVSKVKNQYISKLVFLNSSSKIVKLYVNDVGILDQYYDIPINATQILVSSDVDVMRMNHGSPELYFETIDILNGKIDELSSSVGVRLTVLKLPKKFNLLVGDNFELFYKGVSNCLDSDVYDYELTFDDNKSRGKAWKRKWEWTPTMSDVGTKKLNIVVRNNQGNEVDRGSVDIVVSNKPLSPTTEKVILCIGDSLTTNGTWCSELRRRMIATDGNPKGYALTNIKFIGTKTNTDGCKYEGYGGWTFDSYLSSMKSNDFMNIIGTFDKTEADQHSVYKDSNGTQWKLETIGSGKIKIIRTSGSAILPASGTLTWVSGGTNHTNITYTSSEQASGNPFWNDTTSKNDFKIYATKMGVSQIDHAIILLGWNSTYVAELTYKNKANSFINGLLTDFPNCKITLLGLQVPSRNGFANNYGIDWKFYDKLQSVWNFNKWYQDIADSNPNVEFVNIAGQFDTENCMPSMQASVNNRAADKITVQSNGVHPAISGYYQIADAVLRNICPSL